MNINNILYGGTNKIETIKTIFNNKVSDDLKKVKRHLDTDDTCSDTFCISENNNNTVASSTEVLSNSSVKAYIGCSWFSDKQKQHMEDGIVAIKSNPTVNWELSHYPLAHQYKNMSVEEHPELLKDKEWGMATFNADCAGLNNSDIGIMLFVPSLADEGQSWEMAYLYAHGKPCVLVVPDDDFTPLNLMVAYGVTRVIKLSELATFDFRHITFKAYDGEVF